MKIKTESVKVGKRTRQNLGDLQSLAESMRTLGQLQPIVIDEKSRIIAGVRRLAAAKMLEWTSIEAVTASDLTGVRALMAEKDENTCREPFTPTEAVAMARRIEPYVKRDAEKRVGGRPSKTGGNLPPVSAGKTRDELGAAVGLSGKTYAKAAKVVELAEAAPETYGDLLETMDKKSVDKAYKESVKRERAVLRAQTARQAADAPESERWSVYCGDIRTWEAPREYDYIITDPPYKKEFLPLYDVLGAQAARWLKPGGLLVALSAHYYMPELYAMLGAHLDYFWTAAYLVRGESAGVFQRHVIPQWKPVLIYQKPGPLAAKQFADVFTSPANDKAHHKWGQSVGGMADLIGRICEPGSFILDPFCGAGTTGVAALQHDCFFDGLELNSENFRISRARLSEATNERMA